MKNYSIVCLLALGATLCNPLSAMESGAKRLPRTSLPRETSEVINADRGNFNPVPKDIIVQNILLSIVREAVEKRRPELFKALGNLKCSNKFFYALLMHEPTLLKEKTTFSEQVKRELQQYKDDNKRDYRDYYKSDALALALSLKDENFLKRYLPVMKFLGLINSQNQVATTFSLSAIAPKCDDKNVDEILALILQCGGKFKNDSTETILHMAISFAPLTASRILNHLSCATIMQTYKNAEEYRSKNSIQTFIRKHHQCSKCFAPSAELAEIITKMESL